ISYLCGYGDCSYFTKVFREIMGETPTEYRINRTK
ncbi:MAG: AraC family transcriptional regulator, partial [Clostridia bacterium]|nr:AraC family transcriptional regulator [Clostridia bacterium]